MNQIKEILERYKGKLKITNDSSYVEYQLINTNILPINNPNINKDSKKVDCYMIVQFNKIGNYYYLRGYEATYEIIGGFGFRYDSKYPLISQLEDKLTTYGFIKKETIGEQISLF